VTPLLKILLYAVVVLAIGVLLSPPIYWFCQWLIDMGHLGIIKGFPFHRFFSRTVQVTGIILLIPLVFWLRIRHPSELGLQPNTRWWKDLFVGFLCGLLPLLALGFLYTAFGIYSLRGEPEWWKLPRVFGTAAVVSLLEEVFFRGVLLGLAVRAMGRWGGAVFSALIFAALHFLRPARLATGEPVTWLSGWEQLTMITHGAPPMPLLAYGAGTLLLAGLLLAAVTLKTKSLWPAIGLHAGWILAQQGFLTVVRFRVKPEDAMLPWVGPNVVSGAVPTGVIPAAVLLGTFVILWWWLRRR